MDVSNEIHVRTYLYRCFYFFPAFYKVYRQLKQAYKVYAKFQGTEAIFYCQRCLKKLSQYVSEAKPCFFDEVKKNVYSILHTCWWLKPRDDNFWPNTFRKSWRLTTNIFHFLANMFKKLRYFLRYILNKPWNHELPSYVILKNHLPQNKKKYLEGTIGLCHCRGHNCLIVRFYFDGFYETDRRLYWDNYWFDN